MCDLAPFSLTDVARALCFQSRNHYFDLFYLIHDYVGSYQGGVPILHLNEPALRASNVGGRTATSK